MNSYPQLLLIAGTGQNCGKTTLACAVIKAFSNQHNIVSIKITPHRYPLSAKLVVIENSEDIIVCEESDTSSSKDSSLMLQSGASKSFFVMCNDEFVEKAFNVILKQIPANSMIVCESGGLAHVVKPCIFIMLTRNDHQPTKPGAIELQKLADIFINTYEFDIQSIINKLEIINSSWQTSKKSNL